MIRLALRVRREDAEVALAELLELAPSGVEEVDVDPDVVEYAVYGAPGELPALPDLRAAAGGALVDISTREVGDDWAQRWREFHQPVLVDHRLLVRAPWHAPAQDALPEVVIDPGQPFGTGGHATTRLCLELLLRLPDGERGALLDVGCGSGVLGIAAAKLGWGPVSGLDHDPESVRAARENAEVNGVAMDVERWDLRTDVLPPAPVMLANLVRPLLLILADRVAELAAPPRVLVASGLLEHELDEVSARFAQRAGLREAGRRAADGWAALLLRAT
jgi:ribosomal protein L11 methyltransferase